MHALRVSVCCDFWSGGIIFPFFFAVNGDTYRTMTTDFFVSAFDVDDVQQNGATYHTCHATIDLVHQMFDGNLISRNGDLNWLPRSCGLQPLNYFRWGAVKEKLYADKQEN